MRPPGPSRPLVPDLLSHRLVRSSPEGNSATSKPPVTGQGQHYHGTTLSSVDIISLDAVHLHDIQLVLQSRSIGLMFHVLSSICSVNLRSCKWHFFISKADTVLHALTCSTYHSVIPLHLCFSSTRGQWRRLDETAGGFIISGGLHQLQKDLGSPHHSV